MTKDDARGLPPHTRRPDDGPGPGDEKAGAPDTVRRMRRRDLAAAVRLHREGLGSEFITKLGSRFLRRYYRAWLDSPFGLCLVVEDTKDGCVVGVLLGAVDPAAHYRHVVRRHGISLALALALAGMRHPSLAVELARTRARRYLTGTLRMLRPRVTPRRAPSPRREDTGQVTGEVTHLVVAARQRGAGIGRALLGAAERGFSAAGVAEAELVTPAGDHGLARFYESAGWRPTGAVVSRSDERFMRYHRRLAPLVPGADRQMPHAGPPMRSAAQRPELSAPGRHPRRRRLAGLVVVVLAGSAVQAMRPIPPPRLSASLPAVRLLPGPALQMPWPADGSAAVMIPGVGLLGRSGPRAPVPIASIAKVMTAYVLLRDHPLAPGSAGPEISFGATDVALYRAERSAGDSVLAVVAGERLTELEALEGLLIPSADNVAARLARWDAGSVAGFVARMNRTALALGLRRSHFAGPSGLDPASVSTPGDLVRLGQAAMAIPVLGHIVGMPQVELPVAGVVYNYNHALGRDGIIGIKTGSDRPAGGCVLVESRWPSPEGPISALVAVVGQRSARPLSAALAAARALVVAARDQVHPVVVIPDGGAVGAVRVPWAAPDEITVGSAVSVVGWAGLPARVVVAARPEALRLPLGRGRAVGALVVTVGHQRLVRPVELSRALRGPSAWWRLSRT